jgi:glucose/arabinose dehydrogenase
MNPPAAAANKPCETEPAMASPALRRGRTLGPILGGGGAQAGQVIGPPGEADVLYVIGHRNGQVTAIVNGMVSQQPFARVTVENSGNDGNERGLLGIALHPKFAENQLFYLFYNGAGARFKVDEFKRTGPSTSMPTQNIYDGQGSSRYHNGGSIYFNPKDGDRALLYHSVGNGGGAGPARQANGNRGRILRYDVSTKEGVPGMGLQGFTFAYGLRNPYRMSIDRLTGDMWVGEVSGPPGGTIYFYAYPFNTPGKDFGNDNGNVQGGINGANTGGNAAIGGVVYRGNKIPGLCGRYFFGTNNPGNVRSLIQRGGQRVGGVQNHPELSVPGNLSSFGEDGEGEIWMSSMNGNIYKIEAAGGGAVAQ